MSGDIIERIRQKLGASPPPEIKTGPDCRHCIICGRQLEKRKRGGVIEPLVKFICIGNSDHRCVKCHPGSENWMKKFKGDPKHREFYNLFKKYGGA